MNSNENITELPTQTFDKPWIYVDNQTEEIDEDEEELSDEEFFSKIFEEDRKFSDKHGRIVGENKDKIEKINNQGEKETLPLSEESIDRIAKETGYTSGKWMLFIPKENINALWEKIAKAVKNFELGSCKTAKVATALQGKDTYVVCIYTNNYLDVKDIMDVREKLRELGFNQILYYKPDIYTHLGIYSKNPYVKASRYKS